MRLFASIRPPEEVREHLVTALRPIRDAHGTLLRWTDPDQWHLTVAFYGERPDGSVDELAEHIAAAVATTNFPSHDLSGADLDAGPDSDLDSGFDSGPAPLLRPSLDLHLRGAGSFSGRTLWIGVGGDVDPLRRLMAACVHDPFAIDDDFADDLNDDFDGEAGSFSSRRSGSRRSSRGSHNSRGSGSRGARGGDQRERRRAHLTVARLRAREQGGRRDGRRAHRRSAWAGDRRHNGLRDAGYGRDLARPARHDGASALHDVVHALTVYSGPSWRATEVELVSSRLGEGRSGGALHETVATIPFSPGH